jgi:hypothetical protein
MRAMWPAQIFPKFPDGTVNETFCAFGGRLQVAAEVVHHLRHHARPVDRIDGADLLARLEFRSFDTALTMSWQSSNTPSTAMLKMFGSCRLNICAVWKALIFLCGDSMNTRMPRLPRIAYSAALPVSPEVAPKMFSSRVLRQRVLEQVAQQLHRHVLEGQGRAVRQRLQDQLPRSPSSSTRSGVISAAAFSPARALR